MWNWLNCYLSGRHDYGVACSSGSMYLRCNHCGKQSGGWAVHVQQSHEVGQQPPPVNVARGLPYNRRQVVQHQRSA
jgi:hypothetical protein